MPRLDVEGVGLHAPSHLTKVPPSIGTAADVPLRLNMPLRRTVVHVGAARGATKVINRTVLSEPTHEKERQGRRGGCKRRGISDDRER